LQRTALRAAAEPASTMTSGEAWQSYDPSWIVELAREQLPEEPWLPAALAARTRTRRRSDAYIYFVDPDRANQPGSPGQFDSCVELDSPTEGWLVLDILKETRGRS
jgi:hypothetical protein